jgi:predicted dehydrogenase
MNRRQFLHHTSLGAAGLAFASLTPRSLARVAGSNERIRVGIVGFSDRARLTLIPSFQFHARELNCEIVAVSDIWNRRRDAAAAFFKKEYQQDVIICRNNDELYEKVKPDAVIIATADFQHAFHTIEAVRAGCDVFVEKPFAETMADNRDALKAVSETGKIVQVGSQRRSNDTYQAAHDYVQSGAFGDIVFAEMMWNVNQPGRWRRPELVESFRESDVDWKRFLCNRPHVPWDPRKYVEFRLFWPFSSGIPGQWMCHQIDTVHWFTGLPHPRSVSANAGLYLWKDGRNNADTLTSVFDYGPLDDPTKGFQVTYSSRLTNSAGEIKELYYSNSGEMNLDTGEVTPTGGLVDPYATAGGMKPNPLKPVTIRGKSPSVVSDGKGINSTNSLHMRNWMDCLRSRQEPHASIHAAYRHSIAIIMANAAARTGERVTFDEERQEVLAGNKVFHL